MLSQVTVLVITKNEELAIGECLNSLSAFDRVVVVDSLSTDGTQEIVRTHGPRVQLVEFAWNGKYPQKKQWALDNSRVLTPWVLLLDADERPSAELVEWIKDTDLSTAPWDAVDVPLSYVWRGKELRHGYTVVKRVLLRRGSAKFPEMGDIFSDGIWEVEGHFQPSAVNGAIKIREKLIHHDPDPFADWVSRHNRYSSWEADIRSRSAVNQRVRAARGVRGRFFNRFPFKPALFFVYSYFLKFGWLDGRAGLDYALANSFYYWMCDVKTRERSGFGS